MTLKEKNKRLLLLLDKLVSEEDYESIEFIKYLLLDKHPSLKHSFEIITNNPFQK